MRITGGMTSAALLACALITGACGKGDERSDALRAKQDDRAGAQEVSLTGCIQAASGTNQYVLNNVRLAPEHTTTPAVGITEGAWVKLSTADNDHQLRGHVGKMVAIRGTVTDSGASTIGTSGGEARNPGEPESRTDESRAAAREHYSTKVAKEAGPIGQQSMVNGTAAEIAVQSVTPMDGPCPTVGKIGKE